MATAAAPQWVARISVSTLEVLTAHHRKFRTKSAHRQEHRRTGEYTGQQHMNVETLSGGLNGNHTWVDRLDGGGPVTVDKYCLDNSNLPNKAVKCQIKLTPVRNSAEEYVGIKDCPSSQDQTCGKPLIKLILGDAT